MNTRLAIVLLAAAITGTASAGEAATVTSQAGELMVNQGVGYKSTSGPTTLAAGSLVMVGAGGSAKIAYDDGCVVDVTPGRVELVGAQSPCSANGANLMTTGATPLPAAGVATVPTTYMLAGIAGVAGVAGVVAVTNAQRAEQRHRNAASP